MMEPYSSNSKFKHVPWHWHPKPTSLVYNIGLLVSFTPASTYIYIYIYGRSKSSKFSYKLSWRTKHRPEDPNARSTPSFSLRVQTPPLSIPGSASMSPSRRWPMPINAWPNDGFEYGLKRTPSLYQKIILVATEKKNIPKNRIKRGDPHQNGWDKLEWWEVYEQIGDAVS